MPPHTRQTAMEENRALRSNKVKLGKNVKITLTRCDKKSPARTNKLIKKNTVNSSGKSSTPKNSPKSSAKPNKRSPVANENKKSTKNEEKSLEKKLTPVKKDRRDRKSISAPSTPTSGRQSSKKPAVLANLTQPSTKLVSLECVKPSPIKTTTNKATSKSEIRTRKPSVKKSLGKGGKLRKQLKLGKIYINPRFPIRSVFKRQILNGDRGENQGQFVTEVPEPNNNIIGTSYEQPKIVLQKIDVQDEKPIRKRRKILRHL